MQNMQAHVSARPDFPQNLCSTDLFRIKEELISDGAYVIG